MRVSLFLFSMLTAGFLAGCGPQDRPAEFYTKAENAAEFAQALETCKKSGLSQKEKCAAVWQAKAKLDAAEDKALRDRAVSEMGGTTIVPQSPKQGPVPEATVSRKPSNPTTATADTVKQSPSN